MMTKRPADERGTSRYGGWLNSHHTFSFADYYDKNHMGFGPLRVINDDTIQGGAGFPSHAHKDMEIISYVIDGALEHKDSLGTGSVIKAGEVQRMSAGTGVVHSEYNASQSDPVHFLQIWVEPNRKSLTPGYAQKSFAHIAPADGLVLAASEDGRDGSVPLNQDMDLYLAHMAPDGVVTHALAQERRAWLHVVSGRVTVNGLDLTDGDGLAVANENALVIAGTKKAPATLILFEMAA